MSMSNESELIVACKNEDLSEIKRIAQELPLDQVNSVFKSEVKFVNDDEILEYMVTKSNLTMDDIDVLLDGLDFLSLRFIVKRFKLSEQQVKRAFQHACHEVDFDSVKLLAEHFGFKREYLNDAKPLSNYRCDVDDIMKMIAIIVDNIK
jgi:hypothetical protein